MFPARRRHPLQTFRFWFFVLGTVSLTLAWRLNLLPVRFGPAETGRRADESFTEVVLPGAADWDEPVRSLETPADPLPHSLSTAATVGAPAAARPTGQLPVNESATLPSPPANGQFSPEQTQPYSRSPQRRLTASEAPLPGDAAESGILQVGATTAPPAGDDPAAAHSADPFPVTEVIDFTEIDRRSGSNSPRDHIEAHRELSVLYWQHPEQRGQLQERIDALAQRIYFLPQPHYMPACEVIPGDMLQTIGRKYDVTWQYLAKLNQVDPQRLRSGQRLKVIKGPFSAIIDLSDYELTVHAHGYYVTRYPVGIGRDGSTPIGSFTVQNKETDPTYYGPEGVIEHDDPNNPLGEYWIDIGNSYGIHGTIDPGSVGRSESRGCIRMHNDDVAAVFDLLIVGSEVTIRE